MQNFLLQCRRKPGCGAVGNENQQLSKKYDLTFTMVMPQRLDFSGIYQGPIMTIDHRNAPVPEISPVLPVFLAKNAKTPCLSFSPPRRPSERFFSSFVRLVKVRKHHFFQRRVLARNRGLCQPSRLSKGISSFAFLRGLDCFFFSE